MGLKDLVQNSIHEKHLKTYMQEVERQKNAYQAYMDVQEGADLKRYITVHNAKEFYDEVKVVKFNELGTEMSVIDGSCPFILFVNKDGILYEKLEKVIVNAFEDDPELSVIYFDEDCIERDSNRRHSPWFKADYSPDSLLNSLYMGNAIAVRKSAIKEEDYPLSFTGFENVYGIVLALSIKSEPLHIGQVLYHVYDDWSGQEDFSGAEPMFDDIKRRYYEKKGVNVSFATDARNLSHAHIASKGKVSIVIPSKDHPEVAGRCVKSLRNRLKDSNYDICIVDNGSSLDNKAIYEKMAAEYDYNYIYKEMEFNFSVMCNLGARATDGEYILLLNDDTELITDNAIEIMRGQASLEHVGAVGAKLLYPDGKSIQHIGITNMTEGPAHKLQGFSDEIEYYHGVNRFDRDVIGVTAAALMVSRAKYEQMEGLFEGLRVAYNDVDFCFRLYMAGYYNVIRNDVVFLHYESLSRGNDHENEEKLIRLKNERVILYSRTPALYGIDPLYSPNLTGAGEEYCCIMPFENRNIRPVTGIDLVKINEANINETLIIKCDKAEVEYLWKDSQCVIIDLHCHVRGLDSSDYNYRLLIKDEMGNYYEVPSIRRIRPDVVKTYNDQLHVEMSGFVARIPIEILGPGEFAIFMEAKSIFSRQTLLNSVKEKIIIPEEMFKR